jgi:hypothetical protein
MSTQLVRIACCCVTAMVLLWALMRRQEVMREVSRRRTLTAECRLRLDMAQLRQQRAMAVQPRLQLQLEISTRAETLRLKRLRELIRLLELKRQREFEQRSLARRGSGSGGRSGGGRSASNSNPNAHWHAIGPDGECPATVPEWDWQLMLDAAQSKGDPSAREAALGSLARSSQLGLGELTDLSQRCAARDASARTLRP